MLRSLGQMQARLTAAQAGFLRRFDAVGAHDDDGYGSASAWLVAQAQMSVKDARADVARMRLLGRHPGIAGALAAGQVSVSCGLQITGLVKQLPKDLRAGTGTILLDAAAAGASIDDLKLLAVAAYAQWRSRQPDPDDEGTFDDRYVKVGTTFGGAACISGNLTPGCTAAVQAVLDALGKRHGPEDTRTEAQRWHDALRLGCELLIRPRWCPTGPAPVPR